MGKRTAITDARVRAFTASPRRETVLWNGVVSGLGVRARANGRKTWIVQGRIGDALVKRTLSAAEAMTVEDARCAARALIAETECGDGAALSVPTMQTFGPTFLPDCAERWKPTTRVGHAHCMQRFILPALGSRRVDAITACNVRSWFDELTVTRAGTANRSLAVLSSLMKHAEDVGLRPEGSNPCRGLRRRKTGFKAHYLSDAEFAALGCPGIGRPNSNRHSPRSRWSSLRD